MTALRKTRIALTPKAAPFAIRAERASDVVAREALLDACFGENRHMRTCQRLRDGRAPAEGLAFSAVARAAWSDRAVVARQRRGHPGARARPAGGRGFLPQARGRGRADGPRARGGEGAWPSRGDPARRRAVLFPLRLHGRTRPANCRCPARSSAIGCSASNSRRRARRRLGHDRADRRGAPMRKSSRAKQSAALPRAA